MIWTTQKKERWEHANSDIFKGQNKNQLANSRGHKYSVNLRIFLYISYDTLTWKFKNFYFFRARNNFPNRELPDEQKNKNWFGIVGISLVVILLTYGVIYIPNKCYKSPLFTSAGVYIVWNKDNADWLEQKIIKISIENAKTKVYSWDTYVKVSPKLKKYFDLLSKWNDWTIERKTLSKRHNDRHSIVKVKHK